MAKHWYKQYIEECPVCGKVRIVRERVYGDKPEDPQERYVYDIFYDNCMEQ